MTRYREILRLHNQGISQRSIALSCECSRNTVSRTLATSVESALSRVTVTCLKNKNKVSKVTGQLLCFFLS
ncbi:MAG: helix-turn-helix domain-containing protein [Clostridium sp.]